jgi:hypothetical protein
MWRSKKFILVASLIAIVLVGSTAGVVLARSANGGEGTGVIALAQTSDNTSSTTLLARVAKILGIDQKQVEDAFAQAQEVGVEFINTSTASQILTQGLNIYISHLRQKIEPTPTLPKYIITEPGVGYYFAKGE